jgi:hypothetical protein
MLVCERCGCSGELGMGWLSVVRIDVEDTDDASLLVEYCPPCAEVVFGRQRHVGRGSGRRTLATDVREEA